MTDLDVEMEDSVGIGSYRKVKNLISLTGKFHEDDQERKMLQDKALEFVKKKEEERKERVKVKFQYYICSETKGIFKET